MTICAPLLFVKARVLLNMITRLPVRLRVVAIAAALVGALAVLTFLRSSPAFLFQLLVRGLAFGAAVAGRPIPMIAAIALCFFPMGLYLLGSPSWLMLVGLADVVYFGIICVGVLKADPGGAELR